MADAGLRKHRAQTVEDRLVGNLTRKPDIARRNGADRRAHQRAPPMRRGAGKVGDATMRQPRKMIGDRLAGA